MDDFGAVTSIGHVDGGTGDLVITSTIAATTVAAGLIHDAIENIATSGGQTVSILAGTYFESDIVMDRPLTLQGATSGSANLVTIEPDVASTSGNIPLPSGSHQGIILDSVSVTVQNLTINGNASGGPVAGTSFNYQAGITTLYDTSNGADFLAEHNTSGPGAGAGPGGSIPILPLVSNDGDVSLLVQNVTVENTYPRYRDFGCRRSGL